jgi:hypothetical protein
MHAFGPEGCVRGLIKIFLTRWDIPAGDRNRADGEGNLERMLNKGC